MKKSLLYVLLGIGLSLSANAQEESLHSETLKVTEPPRDGYVMKSDNANRKVVPFAPIRQTDVAYSKRIWREIDLRDKMNQVFASPKSRLIDIIVEAIMNGELTAYDPTPTKNDPNGDSFKNVLTKEQVMARLGSDSGMVEEYHEKNEVMRSRYEKREFSGENVVKFRIKEDWIFDKQRGVFEPRIIGIAPLITPQIPGLSDINTSVTPSNVDPFDPFAVSNTAETTETAEDNIQPAAPVTTSIEVDPTPAFWIYFPEARHVFVNKEVVTRNNDATGLSYDDVFVKRIFSSYIVKQSNPEDLRIKDYIKEDIERLYESERIKKALMDFEQDLWSY